MTALAIGLVLGSLLTYGFCRIRRANDRINWILRGQEQAELTHGWHRPVDGSPVPTPRYRSPNEKPVKAAPAPPARPVFHDDRR